MHHIYHYEQTSGCRGNDLLTRCVQSRHNHHKISLDAHSLNINSNAQSLFWHAQHLHSILRSIAFSLVSFIFLHTQTVSPSLFPSTYTLVGLLTDGLQAFCCVHIHSVPIPLSIHIHLGGARDSRYISFVLEREVNTTLFLLMSSVKSILHVSYYT